MGGYKNLIMIGSSKGGTCAIYFGLKLNANHIFSGAPQYYVGSYLSIHKKDAFISMMGDSALKDKQRILDIKLKKCIMQTSSENTTIHLLYSKNEHTYNDDVVHLISALDTYNIKHIDKEEQFTDHSLVGLYFSRWIKNELIKYE